MRAKDYHLRWCLEHPEKRKEYQERYHARHPNASRESAARYRLRHPQKVRDTNRVWRLKNPNNQGRRMLALKMEMFAAYGSSCSCCGEWRQEFLSLEHLNRDGKAHRKRVGNGHHIWYDLKRLGWPKEGYTILCLNCNLSEKYGKPCPHKIERLAEAVLAA